MTTRERQAAELALHRHEAARAFEEARGLVSRGCHLLDVNGDDHLHADLSLRSLDDQRRALTQLPSHNPYLSSPPGAGCHPRRRESSPTLTERARYRRDDALAKASWE